MEAMRVVTSFLMLTVTGPSLAYPYTRGTGGRSSGWGRDAGLVDYLGGYPMDDQYAVPEYDSTTRYTYAAQRPRINKEAVAAWLNAALDDYILNYDTYSDDDGTWYNEMATDGMLEPNPNDDSPMMQLFFNNQHSQHSGRYSLEDLENMERKAKMEDNTENQLHALMGKTIRKKSTMPVLGSRMSVAGSILGQGQKEEAYDIPATSVRRPVFARTITTQPEDDKREATKKQQKQVQVDTSVRTTQKPEEKKASVSEAPTGTNNNEVTSSDTAPSPKSSVQSATTSQFLRSHYETLKKFLDREREARRNQDMEEELRSERLQRRSGVQKRYATEEETLPEQLASLKKKV
ncbi:uncharacterized protein LOC123504230 isoform X2 [Portunus trituberculatus]|uniref:uncharacterized protein LOC123504230 isoform X2 n=1 Tax=Portunus trituberculatus TaxID=210409 RepID=UPI001E1CD6D4|nr:uncharacterized protein LOC123504230 isoform X2 [Portunus trituberculatus]